MKERAWLVFATLGGLFIYWGVHQLVIIPTTSGEHWDWLSPTPELIEYIKFRFQNLGAFTLANGLFILGISLTGLRQREEWAWAGLVVVPLYILFLTGIFNWFFLSRSRWRCSRGGRCGPAAASCYLSFPTAGELDG
jgi:hypothetical protein